MQVEVEYKPINKKDYQIFIHILAKMFADFVNEENKAKPEAKNEEEKASNGS